MTREDAAVVMSLRHHPTVTDAQLQRQKARICAAAKKWRLLQTVGMQQKIAECAGVTVQTVSNFESGRAFSANILRAFFRYGFDPQDVRLLKALQGVAQSTQGEMI